MLTVVYEILNVLGSTALTQTFKKNSPKMPIKSENRLIQRAAASSRSPSAFNNPSEKAANFMI